MAQGMYHSLVVDIATASYNSLDDSIFPVVLIGDADLSGPFGAGVHSLVGASSDEAKFCSLPETASSVTFESSATRPAPFLLRTPESTEDMAISVLRSQLTRKKGFLAPHRKYNKHSAPKVQQVEFSTPHLSPQPQL